MSLTKNEIRDRVATDYLGILQLGQSLQSQDDVRILQGYDEVYEYLKKKGLASILIIGFKKSKTLEKELL